MTKRKVEAIIKGRQKGESSISLANRLGVTTGAVAEVARLADREMAERSRMRKRLEAAKDELILERAKASSKRILSGPQKPEMGEWRKS